MGDASERKGGWTQKLSRTARVGAIILVSLATAFGALLLVNSQAIVGSSHDRNAHDLEVVANAIENWPRTFDQAARLQYDGETPPVPDKDNPGSSSLTIPHPDLGPIRIVYRTCPSGAGTAPARPGQLFPSGQRAGEGPIFTLAGRFRHNGADVCYSTQVAMARLVGPDRTDALSNVVLVGADEAVLVQFGSPSLPSPKSRRWPRPIRSPRSSPRG